MVLNNFKISVISFLIVYSYMHGALATINNDSDGLQIMETVYELHQQFPYIYEEQSMVMEDRNGKRDTRKVRRYTRVEDDGTVNFLLLFDYPEEIKGVALIAKRDPEGNSVKYVYLPAYGEQLIESMGEGSEDNFLGTDFSIESLTGENLSEHNYMRRDDKKIEDDNYFVVDVYKSDDQNYDQLLRRHFIRQENLYITLTHHYDKQGRISRIQSHHDLKAVDGNMWRANMMLMEDKKEQHQSLIKISKRVFSHDYVPPEIFTEDWLYENYPYIEPASDDEDNELDVIATEETTE